MKLNWCLHDKDCEVCYHASTHQIVKQWPFALKLTLATEEHYQWKTQRNLPKNVMAQSSRLCSSPASALFKQQLHTCNHEWQPDGSDTCFSEFQDLRNPGLVSCHDGWRVCHKQECFYFLSRPLPTSYTSRFTDASRWWTEIRKYVGWLASA